MLNPNLSTSSEKKQQAIDKYTIEKDIAAYIKKEFDRRHSPLWHCVVGRNFGAVGKGKRDREQRGEKNGPTEEKKDNKNLSHTLSLFRLRNKSSLLPPHKIGSYVTHETKHFIYFYLGHYAVLLFKSG